jgi:HicB_like antitoxin of bacterial toxin-antitoxin system
MEYIAYLHKDRSSDYGLSFSDFPGCITAGKTLDEAAQKRVNITARESQLARIDALAEAAGLTRSAYMVRAAIGNASTSGPRARAAKRVDKSR